MLPFFVPKLKCCTPKGIYLQIFWREHDYSARREKGLFRELD